MRLDRLYRAYPSLHPFGVVHWVPVLSNIKTATGCEWNRQLKPWTVFAATVVNNYQFNGTQGWARQLRRIGCRGLSSSECLKKSFETHPSVAVSQWSISSINQYPVRSVAANKNDVECMTGPMCDSLDHLSKAETVDNGGEFGIIVF